MTGKIHSTESFGTVDGPGIRFVIFMQGCPLRCKYCHNPDTWSLTGGRNVSAEQLIKEYEKNASFYSKGGITVTGGEPLLQLDFLIELFSLAKEKGIHTCIDTSGITYTDNNGYIEKLDRLMSTTDLVMLDIKHIDTVKHKDLTGAQNKAVLGFARYLESKNIPLWVRHIVIEGITDYDEDLKNLGRYIGSLSNLQALDVLPYHTMGVSKYESLGIPYPLSGVKPTTTEAAAKAKAIILSGIREVRKNGNQA